MHMSLRLIIQRLNHGEAVFLGIHSAINFSLKFKLLSKLNYSKIKDHFIKYKLPNKITNYFLKRFKKINLFYEER